jgi:hypothetical protein
MRITNEDTKNKEDFLMRERDELMRNNEEMEMIIE